jgi:hypothetical protein
MQGPEGPFYLPTYIALHAPKREMRYNYVPSGIPTSLLQLGMGESAFRPNMLHEYMRR